jgi:transcriptional regulator with XRE-family HTH domain
MKKGNICGSRIKLAREQKGLGQVDLAAALDVDYHIKVTQSDISEIERGARGIKDFELDAISKILKVSPGWLLRGKTD